MFQAACKAAENRTSVQDELQGFDDPSGELRTFAARVQMAPAKVRGDEKSPEDALRDIVLYLWRKQLEHERAELHSRPVEPGSPEEHRCRQLTYDLKSLRNWDTGCAIIEIELAS
jgi:hypothetical protein